MHFSLVEYFCNNTYNFTVVANTTADTGEPGFLIYPNLGKQLYGVPVYVLMLYTAQ